MHSKGPKRVFSFLFSTLSQTRTDVESGGAFCKKRHLHTNKVVDEAFDDYSVLVLIPERI